MTTNPRNLLTTTALGLALIGALAFGPASWVSAQALPFTATWESVPELSTRTEDVYHSGVFLPKYVRMGDGRVAFTGIKPGEDNYRLLLFDTQSNTWSWKAALPPRESGYYSDYCLAWVHGQLFGMLHQDEPPTPWVTFIYDPATDSFTRKADMNLYTHSNPGFFSASYFQELPNNEAYVFGTPGGSLASGRFFYGYIYSFTDNAWRTGPNGRTGLFLAPGGFRLPDGRFWSAAGDSHMDQAMTLDVAATTWNSTVLSESTLPSFLYRDGVGNIGWHFYTAHVNYGDPTVWIGEADALTSTARVMDSRTGVARHLLSTLAAAGRDWVWFAYTTSDTNSADYGLFDSQVYDADASQWLSLPRCPTDLLVGGSGYENISRIALPDGFLLVSWNPTLGTVRAARLRITSTPVPPQVCADLPASLTLDEGTSDTITYHLMGDIPTGGVEVVVERLSGDADVQVVDGATQRVLSRAEFRTVRIVALTDADSVDDQAEIKVRVVQAGGGADPNARTMAVTVRDLYHDGNQPPAIVSPAWADPNPAPLAAGTITHVVASDPDGDPLTYAWTKVAGPGTASFATPAAADSSVTFSAAGSYVLRVTVDDSRGGSVASDVTVAVTDGSGADPRADCNGDGVVNALDLQIVIANFGQVVP